MAVVGKTELLAQICKDSHIEKDTVQKIFESTFEAVKKTLQDGQEVRLIGFGSFVIQESAERQGRNPRTGESLNIPAYNQPKFKVGQKLKDAVNPSR
jgi:DNA-binding protein HU-beta